MRYVSLLMWFVVSSLMFGPGLLYSTTNVVQAAPQPIATLQSLTICKNQAIPSGYVIIREGSRASCPGNFPNTWTITIPASTQTICKISPFPSGYVIIRESSSAGCPGNFPNTWIITIPASTQTICKISPFPSGYVIIRESSSAGCPGNFPNTWIIQRI